MTRAGVAIAAALALPAPFLAAAPLRPGSLVALDALADPLLLGGFGACFEVDRAQPPGSNSRAVGSSTAFVLLEALATEAAGSVLVADSEADPAGMGADPNGGLGHGALFRVTPDTLGVVVLSDGRDYRPGLPPPQRSVFVDPSGVAVDSSQRIFVVDPEADPSALGSDPNGLFGHGAVLSVDAASGQVDLVADGSNYPAGLPFGEPSVFVDPIAIAPARDGTLLVLDIGADPLASGAGGTIFRVEPATGKVTLLSADPSLAGPFDLAEEVTGTLLVSDYLADPYLRGDRGAVFRIDLGWPDPESNAGVLVASASTRILGGLEATGSGHIFLADSLADGLALGRTGTVWAVEPTGGALAVASSTTQYFALSDVAAARSTAAAPGLLSFAPTSGAQGDALTLLITGTGFAPGATLRLGPGIDVLDVRVDSDTRIAADIHIQLAAAPGFRDLVLGNADLQGLALRDGFEVRGKPAPIVSAITPAAAAQGDAIHVGIDGEYFDAGATLDLGAGITTLALNVASSTRLEADLRIDAAAAPGPRDVAVTNGDLRRGALPGGFEVTPPRAPAPGAVTPPAAAPGPLSLRIDGLDFRPGASVDLGAGIRVTRVTWVSQQRLDVRASAPLDAAPGPRDVVVTNPDLQAGSLAAGFSLLGRPRLERVSLRPDDRAPGNADRRLDPGETVDLVLVLANRGNVTASGVEARLALRAPIAGVTVPVGFVSFPDAAPGALSARPGPPHLRIALDAALPCGTRLPLRLELSDSGGGREVEDLELLVGHPAGARLKPRWDGGAGDRLGGAVAGAGDVDGDGAEDLALGSPRDDPGGLTDAGSVLLVSGANGGILRRLAGTSGGEQLGAALAGGRDVDGDGVADLAVGTSGAGARLVSGGSGAVLLSIPGAAGERSGESLALGDFDGDGSIDLAIGRPGAGSAAGAVTIHAWPDAALVGELRGAAPGDELGAALAASDIDGDGLDDLLAGAPGAGGGAGRIEVHSLVGGRLLVRDGAPGEALGTSVAAAGDLDGDGRADVLAGAPGFDPGGSPGAGRALVVSGASGAVLRSAVGGAAGEAAGSRVGGGRDADGDGVVDFAWSAPGAGGSGPLAPGRVLLASGASGLVLLAFEGPAAGERSGSGGVALLDRDGDGTNDLLIGSPLAAPGLQIEAGSAYALSRDIGCRGAAACADDVLEDNDTWSAASAIALGSLGGLAVCPGDEDWLRFDVLAGAERVLRASFDPAAADLDVYLYDGSGDLVAVSAGASSPESVRVPAGGAGTYRARVLGAAGSGTAYTATLSDGASCDVGSPLVRLLAAKAGGGRLRLIWEPSSDPCHEPAPGGVGYRVWSADRGRPIVAPAFPTDPPFADRTAADEDGSSADAGFTGSFPAAALTTIVVTDVGTSGNAGPSSAY